MEEEKKEVAVEQEAKQEKNKTNQKSRTTTFIKGGILGIIIVLILFIATFGIGIYRYHWNNAVVRAVVDIVPFPVVSVDGNYVTYSEFLDDIEALRQFTEMQAQLTGESVDVTDEELKQIVLSQFISRELIENALDEYDVEVTDEEIEKEYQTVLNQQGGDEEALKAQLDEVYGWDVEEFKDKIIRFGLMEAKLSEQIKADEDLDINKEAQQRAQKLLDRIRGGESYEEIARNENDDQVSASQDGDIGFVQRGMLVKEFEDVAFSMNPGDISDLVKTSFGYHIIKFEERKEATEDEPEQVRVRNILIRTVTLSEYLEKAREEATIRKFIDTSELPEL